MPSYRKVHEHASSGRYIQTFKYAAVASDGLMNYLGMLHYNSLDPSPVLPEGGKEGTTQKHRAKFFPGPQFLYMQ